MGTPTSDNERTKIDINTRHLLLLITGYDGCTEWVEANTRYIVDLVSRYCNSK